MEFDQPSMVHEGLALHLSLKYYADLISLSMHIRAHSAVSPFYIKTVSLTGRDLVFTCGKYISTCQNVIMTCRNVNPRYLCNNFYNLHIYFYVSKKPLYE